MTEHIKWSKEEFKAFLLLYAAQTNFIETQEEIDFIESRFSNDVINKIVHRRRCKLNFLLCIDLASS